LARADFKASVARLAQHDAKQAAMRAEVEREVQAEIEPPGAKLSKRLVKAIERIGKGRL
jgi:hypothetical protein